jgi:hypothetical protein
MIQTTQPLNSARGSGKRLLNESDLNRPRSTNLSGNQHRQTFSMHTDSDTLSKVERKMTEAVTAMQKMAPELAVARQVKEWSDERKKRAFSVLVVQELNNGKSVAAAEHIARSSDRWGADLNDLSEQYTSALRVIEAYNAWQTQYEAARSLLSLEKEKIRL